MATFAQRRTLVDLPVDRVIGIDSEVELLYVFPPHATAPPPFVSCVSTIEEVVLLSCPAA